MTRSANACILHIDVNLHGIQGCIYYDNTPIQIHRKYPPPPPPPPKLIFFFFFSEKNSNIFHNSALNIDCGYSLEPKNENFQIKIIIFFIFLLKT